MPTRIDFRDCVHQGIAGPTADHILAAIRAEYCLPPGVPPSAPSARARAIVIEAGDFAALQRAIGVAAFRQLLSDFQRGAGDWRTLPDFMAQHRYGRATPALIDLARLELALALSERAPDARSIGACCLPPALLRNHPDLTLRFHPAWHWLALNFPADQWRDALLGQDGAVAPHPLPRATILRLSPEGGRTLAQRLSPALFAFEQALHAGESLQRAGDAARHRSAAFDPIQSLQPLLTAGAVIDVALHPARETSGDDQPIEVMP